MKNTYRFTVTQNESFTRFYQELHTPLPLVAYAFNTSCAAVPQVWPEHREQLYQCLFLVCSDKKDTLSFSGLPLFAGLYKRDAGSGIMAAAISLCFRDLLLWRKQPLMVMLVAGCG
jgi:hypothetical protein